MNKEIIVGNDGVLLNIPLVIPEDMEAGSYNVILKNIVMTFNNNSQIKIDRVVGKLTIAAYQLGDANNDGEVNVTDFVFVISYMRGERSPPFVFGAADVNEDSEINVTDIVGIIDIIRGVGSSSASALRMEKIQKLQQQFLSSRRRQ